MQFEHAQDVFAAMAIAVSICVPAVTSAVAVRRLLYRRRGNNLPVEERVAQAAQGGELATQVSATLARLVTDYLPVEGEKKQERPFEVVALSSYYTDALRRANMAFIFSLVFASIGFGVIIFSFITYRQSDVWGAVVKTLSGTIIDAVSALFFVQSTNAQKSMADFFEKLRLDRLNSEARNLISEINDPDRADQLRAQLVLKYAGIDKLLTGG